MVSNMLRTFLSTLLLATLAATACGADVAISAERIRTWLEDDTRLFMLEGSASVEGPELTLSAEDMVIWLDLQQAQATGIITLLVYSESEASGQITSISGGQRLVVDEKALSAAGRPVRSELLSRALEARRRETLPVEVATAPRASAEAPSPIASIARGPGPVRIDRRPIDSDGFREKITTEEGTTIIVERGGIEIAFGDYSMRARNIVMWVPAGTASEGGDRFEQFQIYAEGDVSFKTASARLDADRMFYDYGAQRAMLVDAEIYTRLESENLPLVMRAREVRAFSDRRFVAEDAYVTTCEFGLPHYRIQSKRVSLTASSDAEGRDSATLVARGNRFYLSNLPVMWLPNVSRDIKRTHTPLRRIEVGNSDAFGTYVTTEWDLWDILAGGSAESVSARVSKWTDFVALADYYDDRGPAGGLEFDYRREDIAGYALGYYVNDRGADSGGFEPSSEDRWRLKWRQRAFIGALQVDTEFSDISDRGFLPEYFEREAKEGKEQETYVYVKKAWENAQASLLYKARINDFQTGTEYLPQARYDVVRFPFLDGRILYGSTTRAGNVRFRPDNDASRASYRTQRVDSIQFLEAPLQLGSGFTATPFATARGTWYDADAAGDEATRYAASWGAKVAFPALWRVYDVENSTLDIHGLRHIAALDVTYRDIYDATKTPGELLQFDEVDTVDTGKIATIRLKQRLQTRRPSAELGAPQRTVDFARLEAEADFFPEPGSDNAGDNWSDLRLYGRVNLTDDISLLADGDYHTYDGKFDKAGVWVRTDHSPRTSWGIGSLYTRAISSSTLTGQLEHQISDVWEIALLAQYDYDENEMLDETFVLRRNLHRFVLEIAVDYDRGRDGTSVGLRIYPAGLPGTRKFY